MTVEMTATGPVNVPAMQCPRCGGTGRWQGRTRYGRVITGPCYACHATGRTAAASAVRTTPVVQAGPVNQDAPAVRYGLPRGQEAWDAFAARYPAEAHWIIANMGCQFGASLHRGILRYGNLTPRQLAAVQRNLTSSADAAAEVAAEAAAEVAAEATTTAADMAPVPSPTAGRPYEPVRIDVSRIMPAMDSAAASGLHKVRLTLGDVEFKRSGRGFRMGEGLLLCYYHPGREARRQWQFGRGDYVGHIDRDGVFHPAMGGRATPEAIEALRTAAADPQAAARTHGLDTGYCGCCRRLLTDPVSVMAGIGPVCIRRFGWSF